MIATLVRAIAAVAGTPPKKGNNVFPIPCANNSRSAFNASFFIFPALAPHNKDSIIPSAAILIAGTSNCCISCHGISLGSKRTSGSKVDGSSPTIATSACIINCITSAMINPAKEDGNVCCHFFGHSSITSTTKTPKKTVIGSIAKPSSPYDASFSNMVEPFDTVPKKLSICPAAIITAIPLVNPLITLPGINDTILPSFKKEAINNKSPDSKEAAKTPCRPYCALKPIKIALIAPVGPLI